MKDMISLLDKWERTREKGKERTRVGGRKTNEGGGGRGRNELGSSSHFYLFFHILYFYFC